MITQDYSLAATMGALRGIFEKNWDKPFEERWALAKSSEAYRGFQIRCSTSAKVLIAFAVPPLLFWLVVRHAGDSEASLPTVAIAALYVTISMAVSWKFGIKEAETKMARPRQSGEGPRNDRSESKN